MPFTPPKPIEPPPPDVAGSRVLVVDDERAWRVILETDLRLLGYSVMTAQDAVEALSSGMEPPPDVAIVDLMLPEPMDGWALLREFRARDMRMPVVFYTAYPVFPTDAQGEGVVGYMSKAADRADLYSLLPAAIRSYRASPS